MVYVHLADGFEELEALTTVDLLRRTGLSVELVSVTGRLPVMGAHGIEVSADILFEDAAYDSCELIVLPGGMPGAAHLDAHAGLREKLLSFHEQEKPLAAICAAPFVLGHAGILNGRKATCYPGFEKELYGAALVPEPVVTDGHITTSRGPATAMLFALRLVELLKGKETAAQIAADLLFSQQG